MDNRKKKSLLVIAALLSIIVITVGVSFALFNYIKLGTTENSVTTGTITFLYTEVDKVGAGIKLENATPITDTAGKMLTGSGNVFNFKVTSTTPTNAAIPYEVTARMKKDSDLDPNVVKVYLTKGETEEEVLLEKYGSLTQTERVSEDVAIEKTIYNGRVPSGSTYYEETFKLRMWVDEKTDYSPVEKDGEIVYPYNDKIFTLTVNVYADAKVVTQEEIDMDNNANIETITVEDTVLTEVTGQNYNYEITLPQDTISTTLNVETESPNSTVEIEKVDNLAINDTTKSNAVKLSTAKTVSLTTGDNYFKVTVISPNKVVEKQYSVKIIVKTLLNKKILDNNKLITANPTLTTSSNNTSDASGLYKSTDTNSGDPTYYFRGNVTNNYVSFAGFTWRIVRINEDGTIRLIMQNGINNNSKYSFNTLFNSKKYMYYTSSDTAKKTLENWYQTNITNKNYGNKVANGNYFCEQAKVAYNDTYASNSGADMIVYSKYTPNFKCTTDKNGYGLVNSNIGLINYDELVYAGGYNNKNNNSYFLYNNTVYWTMSPSGVYSSRPHIWFVDSTGYIDRHSFEQRTHCLRPVINLNADVEWTGGTGTSGSPYKIM